MTTIKKIVQLKESLNLSDAEFERTLAVKPKTMSDWRRGKGLTASNLTKIADYFNVSVDYLLGRTEQPQATAPPPPVLELYNQLDETHKARLLDLAQNLLTAQNKENRKRDTI